MDYKITSLLTMSKHNLQTWSELNDYMWGNDLQEVLAGYGFVTVFEDVNEKGELEEAIKFLSFGIYSGDEAGFEKFLQTRWDTLRNLVEDNLDSLSFTIEANGSSFYF